MSVAFAVPQAGSITPAQKRKFTSDTEMAALGPGQGGDFSTSSYNGNLPAAKKPATAPPQTSSREQTPNNNLFLGGLPPATTEEDVRHLCSQWGGVVLECRVLPKVGTPGQKPVGALCRMQNVEEAQAVLWHLSNNENALPLFNVPGIIARFANTKKAGSDGGSQKPLSFRRPAPLAPRTSYLPPDVVYGQGGPPSGPYGAPGGPQQGPGGQPHLMHQVNHAPPPDAYGPPDNGGYGPPDAGGFGPSNPSWQYPQPGGGPGLAQGPSYAAPSGPALRSIYISGLPEQADELTLYRIFAVYGAVESCKVLVDPNTKQCRGIGFVNYINANDAKEVVDLSRVQPFFAGPKALFIKFQGPEHQRPARGPRPPM